MEVYLVDEDGFYVRPVWIEEEKDIPNNSVSEQPQGFYRAKRNEDNTRWIEGLSQEEIDEIHNQVPPKTVVERLKEEMATIQGALDFIIMNY